MRVLCAALYVLCSTIFTLLPENTYAQSDSTSIIGDKGVVISSSEGLSQGYIFFIFQDSYGFIWLSTKEALNRYDGYDFKVFRNNPEDKHSIGANESIEILEDKYTNIWLNTMNKGIECYIRELDVFLHFKEDSSDDKAISSNDIHWMAPHGEDEIWLGTNQGIDVIHFQKKENQSEYPKISIEERIASSYSFQVTHYPAANNITHDIMSIQPFGENDMVGIYHGAPHLLKLNKTVELVRLAAEWPQLDAAIQSDLRSILYDNKRARWYFVKPDSIYGWDLKTSVTTRFKNEFPDRAFAKRYTQIDMDGNIWMSFQHTIYYLNISKKTFEQHILEDINSSNYTGKTANSFLIDRSGLWWIGTAGYGLIKYNPDVQLFHHTVPPDNSARSFYHITMGENNKAYVVGGKYIWQLDLDQKKLTDYLPARGFEPPATDGYLNGQALISDAVGNLWLASSTELYHIDYKENKSKLLFTENQYGYSGYTPMLYSKDGSIWYVNAINIHHFTHPEFSHEVYTIPSKFRDWPDQPFVHTIIENGDYLYLGTVAGIFGFHTQTHEWTSLAPEPDNPYGLGKTRVYALLPDPLYPDQFLWAGLNGRGICRINLQTSEILKFTSTDGLPNDVIYGILSDDKGRLWISSNQGISCLQPGFKKDEPWLKIIRNFTTEDGLQNNEYNRYSHLKTPNGLMMFGGVNGINSFYPDEVLKTNNAPSIAITDILIRNKSLHIGSGEDELPLSPNMLSELVLQPDQDMLTIQYTALEFTNSRKNKFKYQLRGLSEEWIDAGFNREANFTKLDPGDYVFTVIGSDSEGVWNMTGRSLKITVLPAWWQTWWFRLLCILLIGSIVFGVYKYRINQLKKIQLVRDGIARDLHDEIGSTLSSISLYSDLVRERTEADLPDVSPIAARISESSHRLMDSMSDIVWAINPDQDELNNVIQRMRAVSAELTEAAGIDLEFIAENTAMHTKMDMESRRNFYLIFREALNNAIKYAAAKKISIRITKEGHHYVLEIVDNGKGFDMTQHKRGNGLLNMQKRAGFLKGEFKITSKPGQGTRVELKFKT
jgi:ligand-binding sensor domain-containing protein/two-component sensor histidine kinase